MVCAETEGLKHLGLAATANTQRTCGRVALENSLEKLVQRVIGVAAQKNLLLACVHDVASKVHACVCLACACVRRGGVKL